MNTRDQGTLAGAVTLALATTSLAGTLYSRAAWTATLPPGLHDVEATVTVIDDRTLQVEGFTYDGTAPAAYFYLGTAQSNTAFANGLQLDPQLTRAYNDELLTLTLPPGETLDGYTAISVWCAAFEVDFSSGTLAAPAGGLYARAGWNAIVYRGAHISECLATIITDRYIHVEHFTYDGGAPYVYFYLGAGLSQSDFANGLEASPRLDRIYDHEDLVLVLGETESLDGYAAISVWCEGAQVSFADDAFAAPTPGPDLVTARSWKAHTGVGDFGTYCLPGRFNKTPVESRNGGPERLTFTFDRHLAGTGGLNVSDVQMTTGTVDAVSIDRDVLTVDISGLPNESVTTFTFPGIEDADSGTASAATACVHVLAGDVDASTNMDIFDLLTVRNRLGDPVDLLSFRSDGTRDGTINIFDLLTVRNALGGSLPSTCP